MPHLFEPITLRGITLRNRIGVSPMCEYSSVDGYFNDWHLVHLGSRAVGGAGLIITEATAVEARGRISPDDAGIWHDSHIEKLKEITSFLKEHGAVPGIQLAHAGRKASTFAPWKGSGAIAPDQGGWIPIAPSPVAFSPEYAKPTEMTVADIRAVQEAFRLATQRAVEAGFQLIEIHGAHGYLINQFLSPLSNFRKDEYGGSFENRIRFLLETVKIAREALPDHLPLIVRLSASEWVEGGWTIEDTVKLALLLKEVGVDLIDCSSGGGSPDAKILVGAGYQVPFAEKVKHEAGIPTAAVGMITEPMQADEIVRNGRADIVLMARELLRDPYWPIHAAKELHQLKSMTLPNQYGRALG